jgi:4-amino-4-deoxy-L-arabinose transferase-like glycosyltransferase
LIIMSSITQLREPLSVDRQDADGGSTERRDRTVRRVALVASVVVAGWSFVELVNLALTHTTGPEVYGLLVAALATGAGVANVALLRSQPARVLFILAVLVVWALVAFGGIAGTVAHIVGPPVGEGPIDPRPRPVAAPLIFTLLGCAGGVALLVAQRAVLGRIKNPGRSDPDVQIDGD